MKSLAKLAVVFVVSWTTGYTPTVVPCAGKEPAGVLCVKQVPQRKEATFKSSDAAEAFSAVMVENKATDVKTEKRPK